MEKLKSSLIKYGITVVVASLITVTILYTRDFGSALELSEKMRILADAFTVPGVILIMLGCLVFVSTSGFFDMISFGISRGVAMLIPFSHKSKETFYEYKTRKNEERFTGYSFLFFVGLAFLAAAIVFTVLFFTV